MTFFITDVLIAFAKLSGWAIVLHIVIKMAGGLIESFLQRRDDYRVDNKHM